MERILIRSQDLLQGIPAEVSDNQIGVGYTAVVLSADAQATIAAAQARVKELQGVADEKCRCFLERAEQAEQQLTQRTAECDALKLVNDTHMKTVMKLSHVVEQQTAELEAVKADTKNMLDVATRRLHEQVNDLQAELERGRGLVRALPAYKDISVSHRIDENDYESWHVWVDHNPLAECDTEEEANAIKALYEHRQGMEG